MVKKRVSPEINALSTILFVVVLMILLFTNVRSIKKEHAKEILANPEKFKHNRKTVMPASHGKRNRDATPDTMRKMMQSGNLQGLRIYNCVVYLLTLALDTWYLTLLRKNLQSIEKEV